MLEADQASRAILHTAKRIDLLIALSSSDLRARYGRGSWKSLKWLLDPFFATGVYLILVTFVIDRPGVAPGLSIACATVRNWGENAGRLSNSSCRGNPS